MMCPRPTILLLLALISIGTPSAAQQASPTDGQDTGPAGLLALLPEPSVTQHSLQLGERALAYRATAGTLPLRDGKGERTAEIFHISYTAEPPAAPDRPITFLFNGGPGAASAFLLLGGIGPRMVAFAPDGGFLPPPARVVDNPDTWLAFTDLVFVDPVGTGYSRAAGEGEDVERRYYGVRQDASAMAAFIRLYLAREGRTLSPVYLAGESYGGFRAAVLTRSLQEESGIAVSGAVLISPVLEFSLLHDEAHMILPWIVALPSMAAVHFQRQGMAEDQISARLDEIERWVMHDYLVALAQGPGRFPEPVLARLADLTGLPPDLVRRSHGQISVSRFIKEYDRANGQVLSRYDGLIAGPDPEPTSSAAQGPDPVLARAEPAWTSAFVDYVRRELGYATDVTYRLLNEELAGKWDYGTSPTRQGYAGAIDDLQAARAVVPSMGVLIAHGRTDLVTPYFTSHYLLDQLPRLSGAAPMRLAVYGGGHMMYMVPESRRALARDAAQLYAGPIGGSDG
jgi:carboxypeptidase C (cathepsin A)